jgi:plastocyanin
MYRAGRTRGRVPGWNLSGLDGFQGDTLSHYGANMRVPRILAALALAATLGGSAGCGEPTAAPNGVNVLDNEFEPGSLSVAAGTTVTWTWMGSNTHNVTWDGAGEPGPSPTQAAGTYTRTFSTAGTFAYHCSVHGPAMDGTIVVQ